MVLVGPAVPQLWLLVPPSSWWSKPWRFMRKKIIIIEKPQDDKHLTSLTSYMIWPVSETGKLRTLLLLYTSSCQLSPTGWFSCYSDGCFQAEGPWGVLSSPVSILVISPQTKWGSFPRAYLCSKYHYMRQCEENSK
jgi:hypothetical protein